ncbi:MAG: TetR/AcrR family transcriptional regulator [Aquabacterium sp.]|jgi:AcrR family transcriptional regulator|nr:MAG: TetR/AcrR family transcriptional regulator [Aquabacterium sp.]
MGIIKRLSFKDQTFQLRETAILEATTRILSTKGFDLMTMDDVAAEVGISKPVLYKHFKSKEELAGAAMIGLLEGALGVLDERAAERPLDQITGLLGWAIRLRLSGGMPLLPSTSSHVRSMLMRNLGYVAVAIKFHNRMKKIVREAKRQGALAKDLPEDAILFSIYARTCDPAVDYLRLYTKLDDEQIVRHMLQVCMTGLTQPA